MIEKTAIIHPTANIHESLGFIIAVSSNYYLNRIWTFVSNSSDVFKEYTSFFIIAIIGLTINNLFLYLVLHTDM